MLKTKPRISKRRNPYLDKQVNEIIQLPKTYISVGGYAEVYRFILSRPTIVDGKHLPKGDYVIKYFFPNYKILTPEIIKYFKILSNKKLIPEIWVINENYIIMDYIEGKTLRQLLDEHIKPVLWKRIFFKINEEIKFWHSQFKMAHGDLNPGNVILTPDERIVFIDPSVNKGQFEKDSDFVFNLEYLIETEI